MHDFEEKNYFLESMIFKKKNFKTHDFDWKSLCSKHDFQ